MTTLLDDPRIWDRVAHEGDCWVWVGSRDTNGYGKFYRDGRTLVAHRAIYEAMVGEVPVGLQLDHLCRNRPCLNPYHLEPVTHIENQRRRHKPVCKNGHPASERVIVSGRRACRPCLREADRRYRERRAA